MPLYSIFTPHVANPVRSCYHAHVVTIQDLTTYYERNIAKITKDLEQRGSPSPSDHAQDVFMILLVNRGKIHNIEAYADKVAGNLLKQCYRSKDYKAHKIEFDEEIHSQIDPLTITSPRKRATTTRQD